MKQAVLSLSEVEKDCIAEGSEFGESVEVLKVLDGKQIDILLNEEQYYEMLKKMGIDIEEDGDIFGIDWEKYDYVTIAETDDNGEPKEFFSFRENWLTPVLNN